MASVQPYDSYIPYVPCIFKTEIHGQTGFQEKFTTVTSTRYKATRHVYEQRANGTLRRRHYRHHCRTHLPQDPRLAAN